MGRLYFDLYDASGIARDEDGTNFADVEAARLSAVQSLLEIMRTRITSDAVDLAFVVRAGSGLPTLTAKLSLVVNYSARLPAAHHAAGAL
jgi:hypothetical protein